MIGKVITAALRFVQLQKLTEYVKNSHFGTVAKAWYDALPKKKQLAICAAALLVLVATLLV